MIGVDVVALIRVVRTIAPPSIRLRQGDQHRPAIQLDLPTRRSACDMWMHLARLGYDVECRAYDPHAPWPSLVVSGWCPLRLGQRATALDRAVRRLEAEHDLIARTAVQRFRQYTLRRFDREAAFARAVADCASLTSQRPPDAIPVTGRDLRQAPVPQRDLLARVAAAQVALAMLATSQIATARAAIGMYLSEENPYVRDGECAVNWALQQVSSVVRAASTFLPRDMRVARRQASDVLPKERRAPVRPFSSCGVLSWARSRPSPLDRPPLAGGYLSRGPRQ
jgi:hypothetical protein